MGLDALLERLARNDRAVTPVTPVLTADVTAKPAPLLACTPVTSVTPREGVTPREARSHRWMLHFADGEPMAVTFVPEETHAHVLARYPGAVVAEPLPESVPIALPAEIVALVDDCITSDLYNDEDCETLAPMYAADPTGTRALVAEMNARIGRCYQCLYFARPGLSDGYCSVRSDLDPAYGPGHPLRVLPADTGATCGTWVER
jgi:hypothetical protein